MASLPDIISVKYVESAMKNAYQYGLCLSGRWLTLWVYDCHAVICLWRDPGQSGAADWGSLAFRGPLTPTETPGTFKVPGVSVSSDCMTRSYLDM